MVELNIANSNKNDRLFQLMLDAIRNGDLPSGAKLPGERELAEQYGFSRVTVRQSLKRLEQLQLICRKQGSGTFIAGERRDPNTLAHYVLVLNTPKRELADDPWVSQILYALCSDTMRAEFTLNLLNLHGYAGLVSALAGQKLGIGDFDGYIFATQISSGDIDLLRAGRHAFVALEKPAAGVASYVTIDNCAGTYQATHYLISQGRKRILFFNCDPRRPFGRDRLNGFRKAMEENDLPFLPENDVVVLDTSDQDGAEAALERRLAEKRPLDAIFTHGDWQTFAAVNVLRRHGIAIPEEISILMYDDVAWVSKALQLEITAVRQPYAAQIQAVLNILAAQRQNRTEINTVQEIQPVLMVRRSCSAK